MKNLLKTLNLINIKGYTFEKKLSGGKMSWSCLYKNKKKHLVVVKFLLYPRDEAELKKFKNEAEAIKRMNETGLNYIPKLISKVEKVKNFDIHYFMMEYMKGITLEEHISKNPLPWNEKEATEMIYKIATTLSNNLLVGIIHRDIHPRNIIITKLKTKINNDDPGIRIIDFGVSKDWWADVIKKDWTEDNFRHIGAISSWSPESLNFPRDVGIEHDIWGLGVLYFKFLTDTRPFDANSFGAYYNLIQNCRYDFYVLYDNKVTLLPRHIIKRCFEVDPKKRVTLRGFTKLCYDFLNGTFKKVFKDDSLLKMYFQNDGDIWTCPNCKKIVVPFGNRCSKCGQHVDEFLSVSFTL